MIQTWYGSLLDDMNTARAIAAFNDLVTHINTRFNQDNAISDEAWQWFWVMSFGLGFDFSKPVGGSDELGHLLAPLTAIATTMATSTGLPIASSNTVDDVMSYLLEVRQQFRTNKQWAESDQLRDQLATLGIQCKDRKEAPAIWEWKAP
jgi:cysteinyl-tRNA synthetase